jgi:hypothetical protein
MAPVEYHLIGPGLIHALGSLCSPTTCRLLACGVKGLRGSPRGSRREFGCTIVHPNFGEFSFRNCLENS